MKARKRQAAAPEAVEKKKSAMHVVDFLKAHSGDRAARRSHEGIMLSEEEILAQLAAKLGTLDAGARADLKCAVLRVFSSAEAFGPSQPNDDASASLPAACPSIDEAPRSHSGVNVKDFLQSRNFGSQANRSGIGALPESDESAGVSMTAYTSNSTSSGSVPRSNSAIHVSDFLQMHNDSNGAAAAPVSVLSSLISPQVAENTSTVCQNASALITSSASSGKAVVKTANSVAGPICTSQSISDGECTAIKSAMQSHISASRSALPGTDEPANSEYRLDAGGDGDY